MTAFTADYFGARKYEFRQRRRPLIARMRELTGSYRKNFHLL